jgi:hypothetical protein
MTNEEHDEVDDIANYHEQQQMYGDDTDIDYSQLKEQRLAEIINKLLISDYGGIKVDELKMFAQEMKTANLDKNDLDFLNQVFSLISAVISYKQRYNINPDKEQEFFIQQLLKEAYSRLSLSNSKQGSMIDLFFKNVNEHSYKREDQPSKFGIFSGGKRGRY